MARHGLSPREQIRCGLAALFDGMQPTGETMDGQGIQMLLGMTRDSFPRILDSSELSRAVIDPEAVPRWAQCAQTVVEASR